jgi:dolichyl-diphosphooligosaccharide--protein glycosyltransferase
MFTFPLQIQAVSQESKEWVEKNRVCDAPGSWYCPGHYPPALEKVLKEKKDFKQLEDFNRGEADEEYQRKYFENLQKGEQNRPFPKTREKVKKKKMPKPTAAEIDLLNEEWKDNKVSQNLERFLLELFIITLNSLLVRLPQRFSI